MSDRNEAEAMRIEAEALTIRAAAEEKLLKTRLFTTAYTRARSGSLFDQLMFAVTPTGKEELGLLQAGFAEITAEMRTKATIADQIGTHATQLVGNMLEQ